MRLLKTLEYEYFVERIKFSEKRKETQVQITQIKIFIYYYTLSLWHIFLREQLNEWHIIKHKGHRLFTI